MSTEQLTLTEKQLEEIGFTKKIHPADGFNPEKTTYEIPCLNGCFYYNLDSNICRWYHRTDIGEARNHICLDIAAAPGLFTILQAFRVKHHFFII